MLVLTRRVGQAVVIDGTIVVKVLSLQGTKIRLGFTVPDGVRVDREEIWQRRWQEPSEELDRLPGVQRDLAEDE
jgi:carbon storage regulator CsrA